MWLLYGVPKYIKRLQSPFWKQHENILLLFCILDNRPPSMFLLYLDVYIFHYSRIKLMKKTISAINRLKKKILLFPLPGRYLLLCPIYSEFEVGYETFFTNWVPSSNFAYSATVKPKLSADYIQISTLGISGIKKGKGYHHSILFYSHCNIILPVFRKTL